MRFYVGVTDKRWYEQLMSDRCDEVNFWNPGGTAFRALNENEMFLFKLHYPDNYIVGGGFFVEFSLLPPFLAWDAFGRKNGTTSYEELLLRIKKYRDKNRINASSQIGCTILTEPFWFERNEWIPVPDWNRNIVKGKVYSTDTESGKWIYDAVCERLSRNNLSTDESVINGGEERFTESMTRHRLGQGAFRIAVTDAYQRRCAITGEKTLPVLEAAHIVPFSENGPHSINNGILLRSDFHTLFDKGYITITSDLKIEVSRHLHEDYGNGRDYYKYHGKDILILPVQSGQQPDQRYICWHNENIYRG